jgi:hypothetical protein
MGLDMYIFLVKKTKHTIDELHELDREPNPNDPKIVEFLPLDQPYPDTFKDYYTIFHQVAYWRKFNALHNWFVTHVQVGIDNCAHYELDKDVLIDLLETLLNTKSENDPSEMMPVSGFFFGSTDVDEYYWERIEKAIDEISNLIDNTNWDKERLFYTSSW